MKPCTMQTIVVPMVFALASACSITRGGNATDKPRHNPASRALTENVLNNATYRIDHVGTFQLNHGEFEHQYGEGITQRHKATVENVAFGDLDNDGLSDAVVILAWQGGGSGTFKYLVAMRNTGNAPRQQASVLLGDRVQISALSITAGVVNLETLTYGPRDPMCCPTLHLKQAYILHDGQWVKNAD